MKDGSGDERLKSGEMKDGNGSVAAFDQSDGASTGRLT